MPTLLVVSDFWGLLLKILWLEDQIDEFRDLDESFKRLGLSVTWVGSSDLFAKCLEETVYEVVLIDIRGRTFNGIKVYRETKALIAGSKVAFLSAWLSSDGVPDALRQLSEEVYVMDKNFPTSDIDFLRDTFLRTLNTIVGGGRVETNRTYYDNALDDEDPDPELEYGDYINLSPARREKIREWAITKSRDEVSGLMHSGMRWFLIEEPSGRVVRSEARQPLDFTSRSVARESHDRGVPCFVFEPETLVEEVPAAAGCGGHYAYYFTVDVQFDHLAQIDRLHFDSGAEESWFDKGFLLDRNIGFGLRADHRRNMRTADGEVESINFFRDTASLLVHSQINSEISQPTTLLVNGLERWGELTIGGRAPLERLCSDCKPRGNCKIRQGLLGQNVLRQPSGLALVLDGTTGQTYPIRSKGGQT